MPIFVEWKRMEETETFLVVFHFSALLVVDIFRVLGYGQSERTPGLQHRHVGDVVF